MSSARHPGNAWRPATNSLAKNGGYVTAEDAIVPSTAKGGDRSDAIQIERDRRYFNTHYNPGDAIQMDYNLNTDVEEHFLPAEYPDAPPEEDHPSDS